MAKLDVNALMGAISGSIGDLTVVRKKNGTVYLRQKSRKKPKKTAGRQKQQSRLSRASVYASAALADPEKKAVYEAAVKGTGRSAQNLAVQDHMRPPVIEEIDLSGYAGKKGETIRITAKDDAGVAQVRVVIKDSAGAALEEGPAIQLNRGLLWQYAAQLDTVTGQIIHIEAAATDHAGNCVTKNVPLLIGG